MMGTKKVGAFSSPLKKATNNYTFKMTKIKYYFQIIKNTR